MLLFVTKFLWLMGAGGEGEWLYKEDMKKE